MNHILLIIGFFMFSLSLSGQKGAELKNGSGLKEGVHFKFDKEFVELGEVKKGEKRNFSYTMFNEGTETIKISYFSYCECTELTYSSDKTIKPGDAMKIDVVFDSSTKDEEETIDIEMELENIDPEYNLPYFITLKYHFVITN